MDTSKSQFYFRLWKATCAAMALLHKGHGRWSPCSVEPMQRGAHAATHWLCVVQEKKLFISQKSLLRIRSEYFPNSSLMALITTGPPPQDRPVPSQKNICLSFGQFDFVIITILGLLLEQIRAALSRGCHPPALQEHGFWHPPWSSAWSDGPGSFATRSKKIDLNCLTCTVTSSLTRWTGVAVQTLLSQPSLAQTQMFLVLPLSCPPHCPSPFSVFFWPLSSPCSSLRSSWPPALLSFVWIRIPASRLPLLGAKKVQQQKRNVGIHPVHLEQALHLCRPWPVLEDPNF